MINIKKAIEKIIARKYIEENGLYKKLFKEPYYSKYYLKSKEIEFCFENGMTKEYYEETFKNTITEL